MSREKITSVEEFAAALGRRGGKAAAKSMSQAARTARAITAGKASGKARAKGKQKP